MGTIGHELDEVTRLLDHPERPGTALLLRGERGIGKSYVLGAAAESARDRGFLVLHAAGSVAESNLPYAALHQLLRPLRREIEELPEARRRAVHAAFGMIEEPTPPFMVLALAVLQLLADAAARRPVIILGDDAQWLDRPSADLFIFLGHSVGTEPVVLIGTRITGPEDDDSMFDLPVRTLTGLDDEDARRLLDKVAPGLSPRVREKVLKQAGGNPLALVELPALVSDDDSPVLQLPARLGDTYATGIAGLPAATRDLLLVAAATDHGGLPELFAAAGNLAGEPVGRETVEPAIRAGYVTAAGGRILFSNVLVRSAVVQGAGHERRQRAHAALAEALTGLPDLRLRHRAEAAARYLAQDADPAEADHVAADLATEARAAARRGAVSIAVFSLEQSARLSRDPNTRVDRLLEAGGYTLEVGRLHHARRLLREAESLGLTLEQQAGAMLLRERSEDGDIAHQVGIGGLLQLGRTALTRGDADLARRLTYAAALRAYRLGSDEAATADLLDIVDQVLPDRENPLYHLMRVMADTEGAAAAALDLLDRTVESPTAVTTLTALATVAGVLGDVTNGARLMTAAVAALTRHGLLRDLGRIRAIQCHATMSTGDLALAGLACDEGLRLARTTGQPWLHPALLCNNAFIGVLRGDTETALLNAAEAERRSVANGDRSVLTKVRHARGLAALLAGRPDEAYDHMRDVFDPASPVYHASQTQWVVGDFADAAVRARRTDLARDVLAHLEDYATRAPLPALVCNLEYAGAVLAPDETAGRLFAVALRRDLREVPLMRARLHFAYGTWLRRQRQISESRTWLRGAYETFLGCGATARADQVLVELRAAGESAAAPASAVLTAQELAIARLAADGLSNREIGQRLMLSPRTVGSHLYRIFPKLGITSRIQLASILN